MTEALPKARNYGLDIIRTISIYLVLFQHANIEITAIAPFRIGLIGVEIFFVLSGFLIGQILFREIARNRSWPETFKTFISRRWLRILPLYYFALLLNCLFDKNPGWDVIYYIFFLQSAFTDFSIFIVSWSLIIEEWFYLFAPLLLLVLVRTLKEPHKIFYGIIIFISLILAGRFVYVALHPLPYSSYALLKGYVPLRFDSLFCGVLLAFVKLQLPQWYKRLCTFPVFMTGFILFMGHIIAAYFMASSTHGFNYFLFPKTLGFLTFSAAIALMVPFIEMLKTPDLNRRFKRWTYQFFTQTSILTYAIYLMHPFIYHLLTGRKQLGASIQHFAKLIIPSDRFSFLVLYLIMLSSVYLVAYAAYRLIEKPALNWRERLFPAKSTALK